MKKEKPMTLIEFQTRYHSEEACLEQLFQLKWPNGFQCSKCKHDQAFKISTRRIPLYECKKCGYQASLIVGTVMEGSRTTLQKWFLTMYLLIHDKRGISAMQLSETIGVTYKTAWLMLHKIRHAMGRRDEKYQLAGFVELDDAFFGGETEGKKRGRGTDQTPVLVGLSLNERGNPQYLKMQVIPNVKGVTLVEFAKRSIRPDSIISSDAYRSYYALEKEGFDHLPLKFNVKENPDHLDWLHKKISNAKAFVGGTFHGLDSKHLQAYLNEFCYRFNRRKMRSHVLDHLMTLCVSSSKITHSELVG
jgi:transposase-like protein